jgi:hypothetical protein
MAHSREAGASGRDNVIELLLGCRSWRWLTEPAVQATIWLDVGV